jgi:hypothetical protein
MPGHEGQDDLSTAPENADDITDIIRDLIDEQRRDEDSFAARSRLVAEEITADLGDLELKEYHSENQERAQNAVVENAAEGIADPDSAAALEGLDKQLADATAKLPDASLSAKSYNLQRFLGAFAVVAATTAVASLLYTAIHAALEDKPAPVDLPPDTAAKVRELVRQWHTETDQRYWTDLANYVERTAATQPLTLADQVLFMNYTVDLSPAGDAWLWDTGQDVVDLVAGLVAAYNAAGTTAAMYRSAATLTYHDRPIPRPVTAGLLRHALGQLIVVGSGPRSTVFAVPGEPGRGEDRLSEPPDDEHKTVEEEAAAARAEEDGFAARVQETTAEIVKDVAGIEASTLNCDSVEAAWAEPVSVASSAVAAPEPSPRLDALQQRLERVTAGAGRSPEASKQYSAARFAAAFFGLAVVGSAAVVLLEYLARAANGQPTDDITSIPADTVDKLRGLVTSWKGLPDKAYWESVASYAEQHAVEFTIPDQIVFMNYTIQLCPPAEAFLWDTAQDKADVADRLLDAAKSDADLPGMYRGVAALAYAGAPLPRAVAADVVRLALGWLAPAPAPDTRFPAELPADGIPARLRPVPYVAEVAAGTHPDAYARLLHRLLQPAGVDDHAAVAAAAAYQQPADAPFALADAAATLDRLPASARQAVRAQIARLTEVLDRTYPVPAGETVSGTELTYLAEPGAGLAAGTVVYVRRTSAATVHFALPHVAVDPATGTPRLVGLEGPATAPPRPAPAVTRFSLDPASAALSVAGNLVWAMPPPWGPIAAGGITLIQLLLADGGKQDQFTAAVQQLEQFITHRDINADATHIRGFADWMDNQFQTLQVTQADNSAYITATLLPELRRMVAPGDDSVYDAIYDLERNLDVDGTLKVLVLGVTIHLLALKMIVQLDAQLAATARAAGDDAACAAYTDLWLADYANLVIAVDGYTTSTGSVAGWASRISAHVDAAITARLAKINFPYRYNNKHWVVNTGGGATGTSGTWVSEWGWTYRDDGVGDTDTTNFIADAETGGDCCHAGTTIEYKQLVHQHRDERTRAVAAAQDVVYADIRQTTRKWQAALLEWNQHLPPRPPTSAPKISGFTGTGPAGNWVDGSSVGYAVAFANQAGGSGGPGRIGPWSAFAAVGAHAGATLTDLPVDPLKMATHRWIYRQFRHADGTTSPLRLVGIVDTTATSYTDTRQ